MNLSNPNLENAEHPEHLENRLPAWPALLLVTAFAVSACTASSSGGEYFGKVNPPKGQVLRYVSGSEPESLDPQIGTGQPEARIYMALFEGLTEMDPVTADPIPGIAETWEANSDNSVFTFHLRRNARWSNGDPITAHDFVYSWRRAVSPELAARNGYIAYEILYAQPYNEGGVFAEDPQTKEFVSDPAVPARRLTLPGDPKERDKVLEERKLAAAMKGKTYVPVRAEDIGVDALDDFTLRLRMVQPAPYFIGLMSHQFFRPVPRKAVEQYGESWTRPEHIITSGPFTLKTWTPYDRIVAVRSPTYWDAANVHLDSITFYPLEDQTTMMNLYKSGEVDATYNHTVPMGWIDYVRPLKDYMDKAELANEYYQMNVLHPPMNDRRVRKAFNMAVDKIALAHYVRVSKPLTSFVPEGIFTKYARPPGDSFDVARARELLAEAGYKGADGKFDPARFPMTDVELTYNTSERNRQVAEFVQAQWKQNLGITVPLKNMEWKTFLESRAKLDYRGFSRSGWVGDYMDPFTFLNLFSTLPGVGDNGTGWYDPKYVNMMADANRQPDPAKRFEILTHAEEMLLDVQPIIPLMSNATNWFKKPYVKGMYANPVTLHAWKFVYIEHDPAKWGSDDGPAGAGPHDRPAEAGRY